jgi:beta-lactamase regulating signal transducer with metallopeptidase domain
VIVDPQWLTLFVLKATLLLVTGMLATVALRSAAARHLVWLATLAGVLALPGLLRLAPVRFEILPARLAPATDQPAVPARVVHEAPEPYISRPMASDVASLPAAAAPTIAPDAPSIPARAWPLAPQALFLIWAVVMLALCARLALATRAARRIVSSGRPLDDARWTALLRELSDRLDLAEVPLLLASERIDMPFACGFWRSTIVLPIGAAQWSDDRRQVVLLHELAHVRRRDLLGQQLGRLACAVYWFHPLVWSAARRLRAESERACDDLVLSCGARASDYAGHLLDILTAARGHGAPATALPMARAREFEGRLLAILDPGRPRRGPGRMQSVALLAGLAAIFLLVAAAAPLRPAPSSPAPAPPRQEVARQPTPGPRPVPVAPRPIARATATGQLPAERDEGAIADEERQAPDPPSGERERDRRGLLVHVLRSDPDAAVRRSAAWALGESARAGEGGILVAALRGDADTGVREMAAWALADDRSEDAAAALAQALRHDDSGEVRATAAWALGQRRRGDTNALIGGLADAAPEVRSAAIWALGNQRLEAAPPELIAMLRDDHDRVRLLTAWALGEMLDPATAPALRAAFAKEQDPGTRRAMFRALAFLGDRSPELLNRAAAAKDPEIRSRAVLMLGGLGPGIWPWPWPWPQPRPMP